jgi:hypothetical protein
MAMSKNEADRNALEEVWRQRLNTARLRLEFARNYVAELQQDLRAEALPPPDGAFAYQQALRSESNALSEFRRVLQVFTELTVDGKIPDETQYRHAS